MIRQGVCQCGWVSVNRRLWSVVVTNDQAVKKRNLTIRRIPQKPWSNHRCKDLRLIPSGLRLKSPLNTYEAIQIVKATCRRLIRARINDCHRRLNHYNNRLQQRLVKLKQLIPTNLLDVIRDIADHQAKKTTEQYRIKTELKLT